MKIKFVNTSFAFCKGVPPTVTATSTRNADGTLSVSLQSNADGATIYYTLDGSTPTESSPVYSEPLLFYYNKTIKFFATFEGMSSSVATYEANVGSTKVFDGSVEVTSSQEYGQTMLSLVESVRVETNQYYYVEAYFTGDPFVSGSNNPVILALATSNGIGALGTNDKYYYPSTPASENKLCKVYNGKTYDRVCLAHTGCNNVCTCKIWVLPLQG